MKFTILFGLVLCLLTVHAQDGQEEKSGAQKIVESTLANFRRFFDTGIMKVQGLTEKVFKKIDAASESIKTGIKNAQNAIKDMGAKGQKYLKCAEEKKPAIGEIGENSKADVAACKETANKKTQDVVEGLKNQAADTQKQVGQVIASCFEKSPFTAVLCATKEATKIYVKGNTEILKSVLKSSNIINAVSKEARKCVKEAQVKAKSETENVIKQIQDCANAA